MSDTGKLVSVATTVVVIAAISLLAIPVVAKIVLAVAAALLMGGCERYAANRGAWPD